jgi:hypothetical protein
LHNPIIHCEAKTRMPMIVAARRNPVTFIIQAKFICPAYIQELCQNRRKFWQQRWKGRFGGEIPALAMRQIMPGCIALGHARIWVVAWHKILRMRRKGVACDAQASSQDCAFDRCGVAA